MRTRIRPPLGAHGTTMAAAEACLRQARGSRDAYPAARGPRSPDHDLVHL
jgi:hypothetical protein